MGILRRNETFQGLAKRHKLQVTNFYQFSDYIPKHIQEMQAIVEETYPKTRGNRN